MPLKRVWALALFVDIEFSQMCNKLAPFRNCEFRVYGAWNVSSFCKQVFRLPVCTGKTMVSTLHMDLISCRDWFCELLLCNLMYVLRMARLFVWQTFPVVYLYPLCGPKSVGFLLANQRRPTVKCGFQSLSIWSLRVFVYVAFLTF